MYFEKKEKDNLLNAVNYEFYYTKNQSKDSESQNYDNYFNFYEYGEGWAYLKNFMGVPFFTYDSGTRGITGNSFIAHHLGIGGQLNIPFETNPYRLLLTYVQNLGTYRNPFSSEQNLYTFFEMGLIQSPVNIDLQFSTETSSDSSTVLALAFTLIIGFDQI